MEHHIIKFFWRYKNRYLTIKKCTCLRISALWNRVYMQQVTTVFTFLQNVSQKSFSFTEIQSISLNLLGRKVALWNKKTVKKEGTLHNNK